MPLSFEYEQYKDYKYKLTKSYHHVLKHCEVGGRVAIEPWIALDHNYLFLREGYRWDGATGPAIDTMNVAEASLVHDALYQLIADGLLPKKPWKKHADMEFRRLLKRASVPWWRRQYMYWAVRVFGGADGRYVGL